MLPPLTAPPPALTLAVETPQGLLHFVARQGESVREALDATHLRVRAACGGTGTCGACTITWLTGEVTPATSAEYLRLLPAERAVGARLACQMRLLGDVRIRIDDPAPPSAWKSIPPERLAPPPPANDKVEQHVYGLAVDLGTTHIRMALWDRQQGRRIATRYGPNPQAAFGADVLNRLDAAQSSPERAAELARLARTAIIQALRDMLKRDVGEVRPLLAQIGSVVIVGNTAMLALLSGQGGETLLDTQAWNSPVAYQPADPAAFHADWFLPNARILLPPPAAGFIGADLIADLIATRLTRGPAGSLLLDIGTNTEIALWDGRQLHMTAVPGGPAFEGIGLHHGMSADSGAIWRIADDAPDFRLMTIDEQAARGFCGSGLVDAIALLLRHDHLKASGRFRQPPGPDGFMFDPANPHTAIHGQDIDAFQRAKAAAAAAIEILLKRASMTWEELRRLCVCGAFGQTLDIANAQAVGLLPYLPDGQIELFADASLAGCEMALLHSDAWALFTAQTQNAATINLSQLPDYDDAYINHLRLRPINPPQVL